MNYSRNGYCHTGTSYSVPNQVSSTNSTHDYYFYIPRKGSNIPTLPDEDEEDDWDDDDFDYDYDAYC